MDAASWRRLHEALQFYTDRGYTYVEAPWFVSQAVIDLTCPRPELASPIGRNQVLVGSAEQSFLGLEQETLGVGKFVALTPCFRMADWGQSDLHRPYFMKVELYANRRTRLTQDMFRMIEDAQACFIHLGALDTSLYDTGTTEDGPSRDLLYRGIELGSYGVRSAVLPGDDPEDRHRWAYGTGLAEPRFTDALKRDRG